MRAGIIIASISSCLSFSFALFPLQAQEQAQMQPELTLPRLSLGVEPAQNPQDITLTLQIIALLTIWRWRRLSWCC